MQRLVLAIVALAASLAIVAPATADGVTPDQLRNAGWTCFVPPPFPDRIVCGNPGQGLPPVPPDPNGRPSYNFFVFDRDGNVRGTRPDPGRPLQRAALPAVGLGLHRPHRLLRMPALLEIGDPPARDRRSPPHPA